MFDLSSVSELPSAEVEILHPVTRAPTGAVVTLMGPEHPERKRVAFDVQRKLRASYAKKGRFDITDPEEEAAEEIERLASFTLGWKSIGIDGKPLEYSKAAALDLYARPEMAWLVRQLKVALGDQENFIKSSGAA